MKMDRDFFELIQDILIFLILILGLFVAYQIIKKILGGSWETEDIILALLVFNLSCVFTIILSLAKLSSDHNHLTRQFYHLAKDFKEHLSLNK